MRGQSEVVRNERGATLVLVAVTLFVFLGLAALAIDLGMVKNSAAQAQRAADAAALAGASAYIDYANSDPVILDSAIRARADSYATAHQIRTQLITSEEVLTEPIIAEEKVRVTITRANVPTWFANTFGISNVSVSRRAAAEVAIGQSTNCVKPFLLPDRWYESDKTNQDVDGDGQLDADDRKNTEEWFYQPNITNNGEQDWYAPFDPENPDVAATGYGSGTSGDRGLEILLKPQTGASARMGNWYQLLDPAMYGLDEYNVRQVIADPNLCLSAAIGDPAIYEKGGVTAVKNDVDALIGDDDFYWDDEVNHPVSPSGQTNWESSPRVIVVALFNPETIATDEACIKNNECKNIKPPQDPPITFSNFVRVFLDDREGVNNITARYIGPLSGAGGGEVGSEVKVLRLVE